MVLPLDKALILRFRDQLIIAFFLQLCLVYLESADIISSSEKLLESLSNLILKSGNYIRFREVYRGYLQGASNKASHFQMQVTQQTFNLKLQSRHF